MRKVLVGRHRQAVWDREDARLGVPSVRQSEAACQCPRREYRPVLGLPRTKRLLP